MGFRLFMGNVIDRLYWKVFASSAAKRRADKSRMLARFWEFGAHPTAPLPKQADRSYPKTVNNPSKTCSSKNPKPSMQVEDIARYFRVPLVLMNSHERTSAGTRSSARKGKGAKPIKREGRSV